MNKTPMTIMRKIVSDLQYRTEFSFLEMTTFSTDFGIWNSTDELKTQRHTTDLAGGETVREVKTKVYIIESVHFH